MGAILSQPQKSMFPLKFKTHSFDARVYSTLTCHIIYNKYSFSPQYNTAPSPAPPPTLTYRDDWPLASFLGIRNFPAPAHIMWTSLDGTKLEAKVDIAKIFKDEKVLYTAEDEEIPEGSFNGLTSPGIYLEVDDRTVRVFMRAFLPTKTEQKPGNKYSNCRNDLVLAWSHTY